MTLDSMIYELLPMNNLMADKGTPGVVTSVPSDSLDDIGPLSDLRNANEVS